MPARQYERMGGANHGRHEAGVRISLQPMDGFTYLCQNIHLINDDIDYCLECSPKIGDSVLKLQPDIVLRFDVDSSYGRFGTLNQQFSILLNIAPFQRL